MSASATPLLDFVRNMDRAPTPDHAFHLWMMTTRRGPLAQDAMKFHGGVNDLDL